jgi:hypothetical protein
MPEMHEMQPAATFLLQRVPATCKLAMAELVESLEARYVRFDHETNRLRE